MFLKNENSQAIVWYPMRNARTGLLCNADEFEGKKKIWSTTFVFFYIFSSFLGEGANIGDNVGF